MMNIPPSEAKALSLWEYEALLHHWNEAHGSGDDVEIVDPEITQRLIDRLRDNPEMLKGKPKEPRKKGRARPVPA